MNRLLPDRYAVYEREAHFCRLPNSLCFGPYLTYEEAEDNREKWCGASNKNYYTAVYKPQETW